MIYYLNEKFEKKALLERFESAIFRTVLSGVGDFELHSTTPLGVGYIYDTETNQIGIIEAVSIGDRVVHRGRLLKQKLSNFAMIYKNKKYTPKALESHIIEVIRDYTPYEVISDLGRGKTVTPELPDGQELLKYTEDLLKDTGLYAELEYDFEKKKLVYSIKEIVDNSKKQPVSAEMGNVATAVYNADSTDLKNYAYVKGAKYTGTENFELIEIDKTYGKEKREVFLDLSSLSRKVKINDIEYEMTTTEYTNLLRQKAEQELALLSVKENIEVEPLKDYNVGEKRTFRIGRIVAEQIVTDKIVAYEGGRVKKSATFGEHKLNRIEKLERGLK